MTIEERNQLVIDNQKLVYYVLNKYCRVSLSNPNYEDLVQTGIVGLIKAIDRYDPNLGVKLSTYATHFIYGTVRQYQRDKLAPQGIVVPRPLKDKIYQAISNDQDIQDWDMYESGAYLILSNQYRSLDYTIGKDGEAESDLYDIIEDTRSNDPIDNLESEDLVDRFLDTMKKDKYYDLIEEVMYDRLYSGDRKDTTQDKLSVKYNLSQSQVSRVIDRALTQFKKFLNNT